MTDLFVRPTCHNSSSWSLSQPCCVWVRVSHWLPGWERLDGEGKGGSAGLGDRVRWRFSRIWQAVDSWTAGSSFSSQRGWNFSPWKSRVINDWGSQNNLSVWFLSRPLLVFPVPVPSPRSQPGSDGLWYDSKCDYVKIFYSKHGQMVKNPSAALVLCRISRANSCSGHSVVHVVGIIPWPQQQCSSWSEVSHPAVVFSVAKGFWGSEKCWRDSCGAALVQLMWVTTGWSNGPAMASDTTVSLLSPCSHFPSQSSFDMNTPAGFSHPSHGCIFSVFFRLVATIHTAFGSFCFQHAVTTLWW